jgi:hypothetical protein
MSDIIRRWLRSLPMIRVVRIAHELGYVGASWNGAAAFIINQARSYNWRVGDLIARFGSQTDKT